MISIPDAFRKFKSRLELNTREQENASKRQREVREHLSSKLQIDDSFLTGSYGRHTNSKPLKDIDIFFVLGSDYRSHRPEDVLTEFYDVLADEYGSNAVTKQDHSVGIDFGVVVDADDNTDYRVVSVDCVPAFTKGNNYEIPDRRSGGGWIETNPKTHANLAKEAHQNYSNEWKGIVRMVKYWNGNPCHEEKPIKPSFLIEVMALDCLHGEWAGSHERVIQRFFATLHDRINEEWSDPAELGPPVSSQMDGHRIERAQRILDQADREIARAIRLAREGKNGEALKAWRDFFGPRFPLS